LGKGKKGASAGDLRRKRKDVGKARNLPEGEEKKSPSLKDVPTTGKKDVISRNKGKKKKHFFRRKKNNRARRSSTHDNGGGRYHGRRQPRPRERPFTSEKKEKKGHCLDTERKPGTT